MTHLEIVNRILLRLRENTVLSSTETEYSQLISAIVVDAYEEVLDAHDWEACVTTVEVDVSPGRNKYVLNRRVSQQGDIANRFTRALSPDAELQFDGNNCPEARLFDRSLDPTAITMQFMPPEDFRTFTSISSNTTSSEPVWFTLAREALDFDPEFFVMELYPTPSDFRLVRLNFWNPPPELRTDGSTDNNEIWIPDRPVYQLALMYAYNERGEEIGEPGNLAERRYMQALGTAIEKEIKVYGHANRYDWRRD